MALNSANANLSAEELLPKLKEGIELTIKVLLQHLKTQYHKKLIKL